MALLIPKIFELKNSLEVTIKTKDLLVTKDKSNPRQFNLPNFKINYLA